MEKLISTLMLMVIAMGVVIMVITPWVIPYLVVCLTFLKGTWMCPGW